MLNNLWIKTDCMTMV